VLEHYRGAGLLREIDGAGSREDVFRRVAASV
jgi:adenylate kinase family enzyme